jgi:hypothetical protein
LREFRGEIAEVAQYRRKARGEEERQNAGDGDNQDDDGNAARRMVAAKVEPGDAGDGGHEDDREEGADVEDQDLFLECPRKRKEEKYGDGEENVAADGCAGSLLVRGEVFRCGVGQPISPSMLAVGCI